MRLPELPVDQAAVPFYLLWKLDVLRALAEIHREPAVFLKETGSYLASSIAQYNTGSQGVGELIGNPQVSMEELMKLTVSCKLFQF